MIDADLIIKLYNHLCCLSVVVLYLAIGIGLISSRPPKRRKKSGTWTQQDSRGATQK